MMGLKFGKNKVKDMEVHELIQDEKTHGIFIGM